MGDSWQGRPTLDEGDADELNRRHYALGGHSAAAGAAYNAYKQDRHLKAAAHHMKFSQLLQQGGKRIDSQRHRMMYEMHLGALRFTPGRSVVPAQVQAHIPGVEVPHYTRMYTPHAADAWLPTKLK